MRKKLIERDLSRTKEDLEDLEIFIKEFSDFLPLAVCTVNPLGWIIDVNKAVQNMSGYLSIEIVGENIGKFFLEKDQIEELEKTILKKIPVSGRELTLITKSKKSIPVIVSASLRRDREGNSIGYFVAFSDITEIKVLREGLERKVIERTQELSQRINELERFHKLTIGRELRIIELKNKIKEMKKKK